MRAFVDREQQHPVVTAAQPARRLSIDDDRARQPVLLVAGQRNGGGGAFSNVRFSTNPVAIAAMIPIEYIINISKAPIDTNPKTYWPPKNAPIINVYTGKRAEQLINGAIIIVANRSRRLSIVRVAIMPGIAHAKLLIKGRNALP